MNTNLKGLGKNLDKQVLKKIMGGTPIENEQDGQFDAPCGGAGGCQCCTASSTNGSGVTHRFCDNSDSLIDAWASVWRNFGYRVECRILWST